MIRMIALVRSGRRNALIKSPDFPAAGDSRPDGPGIIAAQGVEATVTLDRINPSSGNDFLAPGSMAARTTARLMLASDPMVGNAMSPARSSVRSPHSKLNLP
jgi:hypothetical protein